MSRKFKTYYVSGINGDDCNNGEAPETAFGSLDRINNLELNPGDVFYWKEDLFLKTSTCI